MQYLTQKELKEMVLLSYLKVKKEEGEINKINVFPVPDQDTGTNMVKTLSGIKEEIENKDFKDLTEISRAILNAALISAQGNVGIIYTGFLAGFLSVLNEKPADAEKLALAFQKGNDRAYQSIQNPVQGTILDVIEAAADTFKKEAEIETDILAIFKKAVKKSQEALLATREKMEVFRKANVVDAGGLAYLLVLESFWEALGKQTLTKLPKEAEPSEEVKKFVKTLVYRYEVIALVEFFDGKRKEEEIKESLRKLGSSLDVVQIENKMKIHIHTDYPDKVKDVLNKTGKVMSLKITDMAKEITEKEQGLRKVDIGIVTEDITDLPNKILERYQIEIAKAILDWPGGEKFAGENIYQKMKEAEKSGIKTFPKTSQPSPKAYLDVFEKQLKKFEKILCITVSSKISGCYNSAMQAKSMLKKPERVFVLDTLNVAAGEALLVLRAVELIQQQREIDEVVFELKNFIPKVQLSIIFEDPKWIEAGGRATKNQAKWIRRIKKINLHPVIKLKEGTLVKGGVVFAKDMAAALFKRISKESKKVRKSQKKIRVIIEHADNLEQAKKLKKMLKKINAEVSFIALGSPALGAHTGPGTLVAAWSPIE